MLPVDLLITMKPVTFVRTSPTALGEAPGGDVAVCASCGMYQSDENGQLCSGGYHQPLSLDELLVRHPSATYFVQVGAQDEGVISENEYLGVRTGDILTVDRALEPQVGSLVLAVCEGELSLCRYTEHSGQRFLVCGERNARPAPLGQGVELWGVVAALSRRL